jgi:hypothetical protein
MIPAFYSIMQGHKDCSHYFILKSVLKVLVMDNEKHDAVRES